MEAKCPFSVTEELAARRSLQHGGTPAGLPASYLTPGLWEEGETGTHRGEEEGKRKSERRSGCVCGGGGDGGEKLATFGHRRPTPPPRAPSQPHSPQ